MPLQPSEVQAIVFFAGSFLFSFSLLPPCRWTFSTDATARVLGRCYASNGSLRCVGWVSEAWTPLFAPRDSHVTQSD